MTASPRFGSRRTPFDWPLFLRRLYLQPAVVWLALAALAAPASRAALTVLGATCAGPVREAAAAAFLIFYVPLVPILGSAAWYLAFARRRLDKTAHRWVADLSFGLLLVVSAGNAAMLAAQAFARWPALGPALSAVRGACWPGR